MRNRLTCQSLLRVFVSAILETHLAMDDDDVPVVLLVPAPRFGDHEGDEAQRRRVVVGPREPADLAAKVARVVAVLGARAQVEDAKVALVLGQVTLDVRAA